MKQKTKDEFAGRLGNWIYARLDGIESNIAMVISIGIILKMFTDMTVDLILVLSFSALSISYFLSAFVISTDENSGTIEKFIHMLVSWCCSISINGIMFWMMNWPGYGSMLVFSSATLILLFLVIYILKSKKRYSDRFGERYLIRIALIGVMGLVLQFYPTHDLNKNDNSDPAKMELSE
ncbi:MAG: hypothetical protein JEZ03_04975 [Bacteroidales bacterium]|nr:hypothetical protein [Bacteroidales bacterium]